MAVDGVHDQTPERTEVLFVRAPRAARVRGRLVAVLVDALGEVDYPGVAVLVFNGLLLERRR
ncbi:hypothetical protein SVIOM342S_07240 [Streptomyces violaceorubidus]